MIKRQFYREEHGDKDDPSSDSSSSSSSDSEVEAEAAEKSEEEDAAVEAGETRDKEAASSMSSGYESEDSLEPDIDVDSSAFVNEVDEAENSITPRISSKSDKDSLPADLPDCVLKCKSVYKCRICPRIVCLNEETMKSHLNSKRHARSEKLLKENRLKVMLNSDGEIENQETPAELHARILSLAQEQPKKKNKGRQRQKKRQRKNNAGNDSSKVKARVLTNGSVKKRQKKN